MSYHNTFEGDVGMQNRNKFGENSFQSDGVKKDEEIFTEWKNQLENTLPSFWESIYNSEEYFLDRSKPSIRNSINIMISKRTQTIKHRIPDHIDGVFHFSFLK